MGDRLNESIIRNVCETALVAALYPRSAIMVNIQEMQNSGERLSQLLACAINAASFALLESDMDLKFMVAAVSCELNHDGMMHLHYSPVFQEEPKATFVFAFDSVDKRVLTSHTSGCFTVNEYQNALDFCRSQSGQVFDFFRRTVSSCV